MFEITKSTAAGLVVMDDLLAGHLPELSVNCPNL